MKSSLIFRMAVFLFLLLFGTFGLVCYLGLKNEKKQMIDTVVSAAIRNSDIIKASTRYSMLKNQKEDLYEIITEVGNPDHGVVGIRYYAKDGTILFSTDEEEAGGRVDMAAEACVVCHKEEVPPPKVEDRDRYRIYEAAEGYRVIGLINPIENEPECYNAACHAHSPDEKILGVLDVRMSLEDVDRQIAAITITTWAVVAGLIILMALAGGLFIYYYVYLRIFKLVAGTREISYGNLDFRFNDQSGDEIGVLANSFNEMTEALQDAQVELKETYRALIEVEKMDSLGKLSATVAHELNNPLAGILTYLKLINKRIQREDELSQDSAESLLGDLNTIINETKRCGDIIKDLAIFAPHEAKRLDQFQPKEVILRAFKTVSRQFETKKIEQILNEKESEEDVIEGDQELIEQALLAMFINAYEAMEDTGMLTVELDSSEQNAVRIEIKDTGVGIPAEKLQDIFKPFYSTKGARHSKGLGLAVVYGIVQHHGGNIHVESELGKGTTFTVILPRFVEKEELNKERILDPKMVPDKDEI